MALWNLRKASRNAPSTYYASDPELKSVPFPEGSEVTNISYKFCSNFEAGSEGYARGGTLFEIIFDFSFKLTMENFNKDYDGIFIPPLFTFKVVSIQSGRASNKKWDYKVQLQFIGIKGVKDFDTPFTWDHTLPILKDTLQALKNSNVSYFLFNQFPYPDNYKDIKDTPLYVSIRPKLEKISIILLDKFSANLTKKDLSELLKQSVEVRHSLLSTELIKRGGCLPSGVFATKPEQQKFFLDIVEELSQEEMEVEEEEERQIFTTMSAVHSKDLKENAMAGFLKEELKETTLQVIRMYNENVEPVDSIFCYFENQSH